MGHRHPGRAFAVFTLKKHLRQAVDYFRVRRNAARIIARVLPAA